MTSGFLHVGDNEEHTATFTVRGLGGSRQFDNTDGYGTLYFWVERGSGREYLDTNLLTFSATPQDHGLAWNAALGDDGAWDDGIDWEVPAVCAGETLHYEKTLRWTSDDTIAKRWSGDWYVSVADLDDIEQQVIDPSTEAITPSYED